jgi:hypothetical protein
MELHCHNSPGTFNLMGYAQPCSQSRCLTKLWFYIGPAVPVVPYKACRRRIL